MTTAYTSLLGLALPVTGELSGTWGDTVNTAITSLLDTAVAGTTSITTDSDITLTTTTGASNQARQAIILWSPASGTTTRYITAPAQSKMYTVINASGGTQSIVIRGVGPTTGVTILKGESALVAWNGSDFVKVSSIGGAGTFTDLTVTGNTILGDAIGDTLTVNATTSFTAPVRLPSTGRSAAAALTVTNPAFLYGVASTYTDTTSSGTVGAMAPFYSLSQPTLATSNVTTYTNASTLYIANAPTTGGSATITNPYALYVAAGNSFLGGNLLFTDNTYDIGASGATRPRTGYFGTGLSVNVASGVISAVGSTSIAATNQIASFFSPGSFQNIRGYSYHGGNTSGYTFVSQGANNSTSGSGGFSWYTSANSANSSTDGTLTQSMILSSTGTLGVLKVPNTWGSDTAAIQMGGSTYSSISGDARLTLLANAYWDGTNWKYTNTGSALQYRISAGTTRHEWYVAPSGSSNATISSGFTNPGMVFDSSLRLGVGQTNPIATIESITTTPGAGFIGLRIGGYTGTATARSLYSGVVDNTYDYFGTAFYQNSGQFQTEGTSAAFINFSGGDIQFFGNTGLSANVNYNPTVRATIASNGNFTNTGSVVATGDVWAGGNISGTTIPTLNRAMYVESATNNAVVGYSMGIWEGTNNRRGSMFLDDANGIFGWDVTASSGVPFYQWRAGGGELMRLSGGFLGINNTSPNTYLDILAPDATTADLARFRQTNQGNLLIQSQQGSQNIGGSNGILFYNSVGSMGFRTGTTGTAQLLIQNDGSTMIGTAAPSNSGTRLTIAGASGASASTLYVGGLSNTTAGQIGGTIVVRDTTASSSPAIAGFSGIAFTSGPATDYTVGKYWAGSGAGAFCIKDAAGSYGTSYLWIEPGNGNTGIGTQPDNSTLPRAKLNVYQTTAYAATAISGPGGNQGTPTWITIVRQLPVVSTGNKINIPFINQGSINLDTIVRVRGVNANYNQNNPLPFVCEFACGHLGTVYNLSSWGLDVGVTSVTSSGLTVTINLSNSYTGTTSNGVFVVIEYLTSFPTLAIDVPNIAMN